LIERLKGDPPSPYELRFGFSRVATAGPFVNVGGTTSVDEDGVVLGDTPYEQTIGVSLEDVVQTRIYVTDISRFEEVGRAHGELFSTIRPLMTMVEVKGLVDPRMLVEIEAVAYHE
jgi:enamine deaminase RidA (YjgF/YER057c/UK114 family)